MEEHLLISNVMLVSGALLLLWSFWLYTRTREWRKRLVRTEAEVVEWLADEDDSGISYRAVYRYAGIDNDVVGGNHAIRTRRPIGEKATIWYDPSYPTNAFLDGSNSPACLPGCIFGCGLALALCAIWFRFNPL